MLRILPTLVISALLLSLLMLTPAPSIAAQVTLAWDPCVPKPKGYRIYKRTEGGTYNYKRPVWTGSKTSGIVKNLKNGTKYYFVVRSFTGSKVSDDSNEVSFSPGTYKAKSTGTQQPYKGKPWNIPGVIEAENYDSGGKGIAFNDKTLGNKGKQYRQDDVDIWKSSTKKIGYYTGDNRNGEWLEYTVDVKTSGKYILNLDVATPKNGRKMQVLLDGKNISGTINIQNTKGWNTWKTVKKTVQLQSGEHVLRVLFKIGGLNFNRLRFTRVGEAYTASGEAAKSGGYSSTGLIESASSAATSDATATSAAESTEFAEADTSTTSTTQQQQPRKGDAWTIPGTIEAEDYDLGGQGSAYRDTTSGNRGGQYRKDDVDIWKSNNPEVGYYTGANASGEWLEYTVHVEEAGTYSLDLYIATPNEGKQVRIFSDGKDITGPVLIPNTGGWGNWDTVMKTVELSAGEQVLRVLFDKGGLSFNWLDIYPIGGEKLD